MCTEGEVSYCGSRCPLSGMDSLAQYLKRVLTALFALAVVAVALLGIWGLCRR